jgi:DNA-binding GntR family transcriptional regulator
MKSKSEAKPRHAKPAKKAVGADKVTNAEAFNPLYAQVASVLKEEIVSGAFPVGSQLPTEEELCVRFNVSRNTVREALRQLRDDNFVVSRKRAGTTVLPPKSSTMYIHDFVSVNHLHDLASGVRFAAESIKTVEIDRKLHQITGLDRSETWVAVCGVVYKGGEELPLCWAEYYIHRDFAAIGRLLGQHIGPIFPLIEARFGVNVAEVQQEISAILLSPPLATSLKAKANTPALSVRHVFTLTNGKIAQVVIGTYTAARYRHAVTMRPAKAMKGEFSNL